MVKQVQLQPWKWTGFLLAGGTSKDAVAFVKKQFNGDSSANEMALGHTWMRDDAPFVLWTRKPGDWPVLAHEALHVVSGVLAARGVAFSESSEEAYCYTVEHLLRQAGEKSGWREVTRRMR